MILGLFLAAALVVAFYSVQWFFTEFGDDA